MSKHSAKNHIPLFGRKRLITDLTARNDELTRLLDEYGLTYELTNNKTENSNPIDLNLQVFQNGHQLQTAVYTQTPDGYDVNSYTSALQPGTTGTVTLGYVLEDENNPVTVEVSGTVDASGQKVTHEFTLQ